MKGHPCLSFSLVSGDVYVRPQQGTLLVESLTADVHL